MSERFTQPLKYYGNRLQPLLMQSMVFGQSIGFKLLVSPFLCAWSLWDCNLNGVSSGKVMKWSFVTFHIFYGLGRPPLEEVLEARRNKVCMNCLSLINVFCIRISYGNCPFYVEVSQFSSFLSCRRSCVMMARLVKLEFQSL